MKLPILKQSGHMLNGDEYDELEQKLKALEATYKIKEVDIAFKGEQFYFGNIKTTKGIYDFIREQILEHIEVQERFIVLFLNHAHKVTGYYHHATGSMTSVPVDVQLIAAAAVRCLARGVIVAHNHPSGTAMPSEADKRTTRSLKKALDLFDINLIDHLIITRSNGYYSFREHMESSLKGIGAIPESNHLEEKLMAIMDAEIEKLTPANSPALYAMMQQPGGREQLRDSIIRKMIAGNLIVQAAIPQLESDLNLM
jgi:hypothetical protein